ncbi:MAG: HAD family hydrolase [Bacteroidota bacterium]
MKNTATSKTFLLFDIDGTLLYSDKRDSQVFAQCYGQTFGRPFPTIDWTQFPEVTDHVIFRTAFYDHFKRYPLEQERLEFEEKYLAALAQVRREEPRAYREVPGAAAFWRRLDEREDIILGIATGGWQRPAAIKLAHIGLPPTPTYAAYANDKFSRVDILQEAIDLAAATHEVARVIYFGDAIWDLTTTRKMGIPMVGVRWRGDHHILKDQGQQYVITDYRQPDQIEDLLAALTTPEVRP